MSGVVLPKVRPSFSIDSYRDQVIDAKQVAADLNVDALLTSTFVKDGDDLRTTAQLVEVKPDKILWREASLSVVGQFEGPAIQCATASASIPALWQRLSLVQF